MINNRITLEITDITIKKWKVHLLPTSLINIEVLEIIQMIEILTTILEGTLLLTMLKEGVNFGVGAPNLEVGAVSSGEGELSLEGEEFNIGEEVANIEEGVDQINQIKTKLWTQDR